jgi:hypothetical protein
MLFQAFDAAGNDRRGVDDGLIDIPAAGFSRQSDNFLVI